MTAERVDLLLHVLALLLGLFSGMCGLAFFIVGVSPGYSAHWAKQYAYAAVALAGSYYFLSFALT